MESSIMADEVDTHLSELWRQAARDVAVQMVRVSLQKDISLEALRRALDHAAKHADLTQVHMCDVLQGKSVSAVAQQGAQGDSNAAERPERPVRTRRKPQVTAAIRSVLLDSLQGARNGLITPELGEAVRAAGHSVGNQKINLVLNAMERSNMVESDDARPKTWRIKAPRGRAVAEPVVIRRANRQEPETEAEAASLMSHQEITAAAANLRDRFFAQT